MAEDLGAFRYARHLLLEGWDQAVIAGSTVAVVGVGALGCEIAKNLALVGVGTLHLIDMDVIETSNLSRQMFFIDADRGRPKAEVAAERIASMNPDVTAAPHVGRFQDLPRSVLSGVDVIAGGLDTFSARLQLNELAWELGRVYIDSAATGFKGNVHVIIPPGQGAVGERTACMRCFYPVQPADDAGAAACTLPGHARTREHCILKGEEMFIRERGAVEDYTAEDLVEIAELARRTSVESPYLDEQTFTAPEVENVVKNKLPAIITVNAVVASILSHEVLKALHRIYERDIGPLLDPPYLEYSARYGIFTPMGIEPDEGCPVCGTGAGVGTLTVTTPTVGGLLEALSGMGIAADGALVTRALDGTVVSRPGGGGDGTPLADLGVSDAERIRVTYREDGERRSVVLEVAVEEDR